MENIVNEEDKRRNDYPMWYPHFYNVISYYLRFNQNKEQDMTEISKTDIFSVYVRKVNE